MVLDKSLPVSDYMVTWKHCAVHLVGGVWRTTGLWRGGLCKLLQFFTEDVAKGKAC